MAAVVPERFVNVKTGAVTRPFGAGYALGSAFVDVDVDGELQRIWDLLSHQ